MKLNILQRSPSRILDVNDTSPRSFTLMPQLFFLSFPSQCSKCSLIINSDSICCTDYHTRMCLILKQLKDDMTINLHNHDAVIKMIDKYSQLPVEVKCQSIMLLKSVQQEREFLSHLSQRELSLLQPLFAHRLQQANLSCIGDHLAIRDCNHRFEQVQDLQDACTFKTGSKIKILRKYKQHETIELSCLYWKTLKVRGMDCSYKPWKTLPKHFIENFIGLRYLIIKQCQLEVLPDTLHLLQQLEYINVSDNNLTTIPSAVLNKLKTCIVSRNNITAFPPVIFEHIEKLDVSFNAITKIPETYLLSLHSLKTLHLDGNKLVNFPYRLIKSKYIAFLTIQNNQPQFTRKEYPIISPQSMILAF